jgi:hypothetical protein
LLVRFDRWSYIEVYGAYQLHYHHICNLGRVWFAEVKVVMRW